MSQDGLELAGVRSRAGDYVISDLVLRVDCPEIAGDAVEQYALHADHLPGIAYCWNVAHAESVAAAFRAAGYRAECVHGDLKVRDRDRLIASLGTGEIELLTSGDLISEGLDIPNVGALILLRPTNSLTLCLQQIGPWMRPTPGKKALVVLDHVGNVIEHGLPEEERKCSLAGVEEIKKTPLTVLANGEAVRLRREITKVADELKELSQGRLDTVARMPYWQAIHAGFSEAELRHYARVHRYKRGWAAHRLRAQRAFAP